MAETSTSISDLPQMNVQNTVTTSNNPQMSQAFQHKLQQAQQQQIQQVQVQPQQQMPQQQMPQQQIPQQQQQIIPMSQETNSHTNFHSIMNSLESANVTKLHNRDIPQYTNHITTDVESTPNYIPTTNQRNDFIEEENHTNIQNDYASKKFTQNVNLLDMLVEKIHIVIVSILLYFIFYLPYTNTLLKKVSSSFFTVEGNLSLIGISVKSILFGSVFTLCDQAVNYMNI